MAPQVSRPWRSTDLVRAVVQDGGVRPNRRKFPPPAEVATTRRSKCQFGLPWSSNLMIIFGCKPGATKFRNCLGLCDTCPQAGADRRVRSCVGQVSHKPKQKRVIGFWTTVVQRVRSVDLHGRLTVSATERSLSRNWRRRCRRRLCVGLQTFAKAADAPHGLVKIERRLLRAANLRCRPSTDIHRPDLVAISLTFSLSTGTQRRPRSGGRTLVWSTQGD